MNNNSTDSWQQFQNNQFQNNQNQNNQNQNNQMTRTWNYFYNENHAKFEYLSKKTNSSWKQIRKNNEDWNYQY